VYVVAVTKAFVLPVHLNVCSNLSSDHLPGLKDGACRAAFQNYMTSHEVTGPPQDCSVANPVAIDKVVGKPVDWTVQSSRLYFILTFLLHAINITILTL
jgi:hypothetical protein